MLSTALVLPVLTAVFATHFTYASPAVHRRSAPTVQLNGAKVAGTVSGSVESFRGISYAQPPVGDLRFRLPQLKTSYEGTVDATYFGNQCIQSPLVIPPTVPLLVLPTVLSFAGYLLPNLLVPESEDCLNLNVIRPANTPADAKLPVLFWIHGGAFALGSNAMSVYNGSAVVERSIQMGEPVIFVGINYRLNVFGFLGGKEMNDAGVGNLGLHDQRTALRWVQKYISSFGGDPAKVTIWGESAGGMSVALHMLTNGGNTEGLFRAGIMSSGSPVPTGNATAVQGTFDTVAKRVGCSGAADVLQCLRGTLSPLLVAAAVDVEIGIGYSGLATSYMPHIDGSFVTAPPQQLAAHGPLAKVPFILGDVTDEGPIFSLGSTTITTTDQLADYLGKVWFPGATRKDVQPLLDLYPQDPAAGSPYNTGENYAYSPQYKRIASLQGDWFFNAPRRQLLQKYSSTQPAYTYLHSRGSYPGLGQPHTTDLKTAFGPGDLTDYFVRFVNDLNPNGANGVQWPRYDDNSRKQLKFDDTPIEVVTDDARFSGTEALTALSLRFPF